MKIKTQISRIYNLFCLVIIFSFPLIFFLPQQFYQNMYLSTPFWWVVLLGLFLLPKAFQGSLDNHSKIAAIPIIWISFLIALTLSYFFSTNYPTSLPILWLNFAYFVIFQAINRVLFLQELKEKFAAILMGVVAILSAISFYNIWVLGYVDLTSEGLSFMWGYFGHNHLASLLLAIIPFSIYFLWFSVGIKRKILFCGVFILFLYSFLISFSRAANLSLIIALILGAVIFNRSFFGKISYKAAAFYIVVILLLVFSFLVIWDRKSLRSVYIRSAISQKGVEMFMEKPILGYGPGAFGRTKINQFTSEKGAFYPHNLLVQNLAEGGLILTIPAILLYLYLISKLITIINTISAVNSRFFYMACWIGLVGLLINELMDFDLQLPAVGALFWILSGMTYSLTSKDNISRGS